MSDTHLAPPPILALFLLLLLHPTAADDMAVMAELKKGLTFLNKSMWIETDPCKWWKVQCQNNRITRIQIGDKNVTGTLPSTLNQLPELSVFEVMRNDFSGPLPSFSGLSSLQSLLLNDNKFTSIPDDFFKGLTSLQSVSLDNNQFHSWQIPESLKEASALKSFSAAFCNITGTIPNFLGSFASLNDLRLSYNYLEGGLPGTFSGSSIRSLWLNGQNSASKLNGSIAVIGNMSSLVEISLQANAFTGPIPDVSALISLTTFIVRENSLTGPVPDSLVKLPSLKIVELNNNMFQGKMPQFATGVTVQNGGLNKYCLSTEGVECDWRVNVFLKIAEPLGYPAVLANDWSGNDPCAWGSVVTCDSLTKNVTMVNLQNKRLSGTIAPEFSNFSSLQRIYLNNNSLSGTIPDVFTSMPNLALLDISYNDRIYGKLPNFRSNVVVLRNGTRIGQDDPGPAPSGAPGSSPPDGVAVSKSNKSKSTIVGIIVGSIAGFLALCGVLFFVVKRRKCSDKVQNPDANNVVIHPRLSGSDQDIKITISGLRGEASGGGVSHSSSGPNAAGSDVHVVEHGNMVISIQVLRNVTNNFSQENILGSGGFGTVYKGELHDGTKIAVKRMESGAMSNKGLTEFQAEIAVLTKVRHRHLVALLGYCLEGNERLLVYEYMPQGTLSSHIFNWAKENLKPLEWSRRLTIALDVARGVEYLHSLAHQSFVHRDLKPSNILLGDDMRAKVADFGLVRLAPDGKMSFATKLAGTFGYLAPEYAVTGRVTTKVDVFSFGVILMELITGRRALDDSQPDESCHLVTWFRRMAIDPKTFTKAIDPVIDLTEETLSSIRTVAELAGHCSARDPHQRPDMSHVVNVLSSLSELWKPTEQDPEDAYGIDLDMTLPQALKKWQQSEGNSNADFSSSSFFGNSSGDNTETSIPTRPYGFCESFATSEGR